MRQTGRFRALLLMIIILNTIAQAGVVVAPARLEAVVGPDGNAPGLRIANTGSNAVTVKLSLADGGHDLDGAPLFDESITGRQRWADRIFLDKTELFLGPQESTDVRVRALLEEGQGLYPVIMAEIRPVGSSSVGVETVARVAVPVLLTRPPAQTLVSASGLIVSQESAGGPVLIEGILRNEGSVHVRAGARIAIEGPGIVDEILLNPVTVLPGLARRVRGEWRPESMPPGDYVAHLIPTRSHTDFENPGAGTSVSFGVLRPYELASAKPILELFDVRRNVDSALSVEALISNRGNITEQARLEINVLDRAGDVIGHRDWELSEVNPGTARVVAGEIPLNGSSQDGYLVRASLWHNGHQVAEEIRSVHSDPGQVVADG
ncbi:MAG: hypothetical protein GX162_00475 [Firmicutes bacterium]|jgi:hypothetical protein|nr:hypothetical protein [Bacillota bacterium]